MTHAELEETARILSILLRMFQMCKMRSPASSQQLIQSYFKRLTVMRTEFLQSIYLDIVSMRFHSAVIFIIELSCAIALRFFGMSVIRQI